MDGTNVIFDCPVSPWIVGGAGAAAALVVLVFVTRDVRRLGWGRRLIVPLLGLAAAVMLTGMALNPRVIRTWPDTRKPACGVLVDGSRSMRLDDEYAGDAAAWLADERGRPDTSPDRRVSREAVVRLLLKDGEDGWVAGLRTHFRVTGQRFASALEDLPLAAGAPGFAVIDDGYTTALGEMLEAASHGAGGNRPKALVLISDGAWNTGRDPTEVARLLGRTGMPVFVVGVGNPDPPRDAAVLALKGPTKSILGDELLLTAQVAASGMGAIRLPVELACDGEVIDRKDVVALPSGRPVNVVFSYMPTVPGHRFFGVRVAAQADERDPDNNATTLAVDVVERKVGVLMVESEPRWEFRFVRSVLERDPAVTPSIALLRPGVGPIRGAGYIHELPTDKKALAAYDLVILGDVPRASLPDAFLKEVAAMVRHRGGGLIVMAGPHGRYRELIGTPLADVLPVALDAAGGFERLSEPFRAEITQDGATHLVTRLAGTEGENESIWSRLPELRWSAGVGGLSRGAVALLVHPYRLAGDSKLPILAAHRVGAGKVMFSGMDGTWRWRKAVGDRHHYRFWAQVVRWMVKKQFTEGDPRARLSADRTECDAGERVTLEAYCLGPDGFPLEGARVWLTVAMPDGGTQRLAMQPAPGGWGLYRATLTPRTPGAYTARPVVDRYGEEPIASAVTITAARVDLEKNVLAQDRRTLAAVAQASGGAYLEPHEAHRLPALLAATLEVRHLTAEYAPCRHWLYYTALAAILGLAWLIRKRSGLA